MALSDGLVQRMRSGDLRHVVSIQYPVEGSDGMGGFATSWADLPGLSAVRAAIWPSSANEQVKNGTVSAEITHRVKMRYRPGINHSMRIVFGNRILKIVGITSPEESNKELNLLCKEQFA